MVLYDWIASVIEFLADCVFVTGMFEYGLWIFFVIFGIDKGGDAKCVVPTVGVIVGIVEAAFVRQCFDSLGHAVLFDLFPRVSHPLNLWAGFGI